MIQNLIFAILFLKIVFRAYNVFTFVQTFQWTSSDIFFSFRFSSRKSKNQELANKVTDFTIRFCSKSLTHFTNFNSLDIENNMLRSTAKNLSEFTNFPVSMFLCGVRKNICTTPFLDAQELHFWITLKANVCMFLYISLKKFHFRGVVLSGGGGMGGNWIISSWRVAVLALQNIL